LYGVIPEYIGYGLVYGVLFATAVCCTVGLTIVAGDNNCSWL
jgi:hypothetical protein